jgi:Arc/MetJ-type ribon-helix-helix transcriptional regulator
MTQRVTVSLPDDVAERLSREGNASAYVTAALRNQMDREETQATLAAHGIEVTAAGLARARKRLDEAKAKMTPERYAELRKVGRAAA